MVPPTPLVVIPTALPEIFPTPINSLPIKSNETFAVIPLTLATLTDVALTLNAAPPALSTVVDAVLFSSVRSVSYTHLTLPTKA